jgi:hypothetical protein
MQKRNILTKSSEVYEKLKLLNFTNNVIVENVKKGHFENLMRNINSGSKILEIKEIEKGKFSVKKVNPINFRIYKPQR